MSEKAHSFLTKAIVLKIYHTLSGDLFGDHLRAVQRVLKEWNYGKDLELAGLFHSIYGTEGFQAISIALYPHLQAVKMLSLSSSLFVFLLD
jgi:hypothetical protein